MFLHIAHCSKSSFFVQKINFDFPRKLSIFYGRKTRENVVVLDVLAVDNFNFTRKTRQNGADLHCFVVDNFYSTITKKSLDFFFSYSKISWTRFLTPKTFILLASFGLLSHSLTFDIAAQLKMIWKSFFKYSNYVNELLKEEYVVRANVSIVFYSNQNSSKFRRNSSECCVHLCSFHQNSEFWENLDILRRNAEISRNVHPNRCKFWRNWKK